MRTKPRNRTTAPALAATALIACVMAMGFTAMTVSPAEASIKCRGVFQLTSQGPIATPICQNRQIAKVAQRRGWRVTSKEISNYPLKRMRICQAVGNDTRLQGACDPYRIRGLR